MLSKQMKISENEKVSCTTLEITLPIELCSGTAPCSSTMTFSGCHRNLRAALTSAQGSSGNPSGKVAHVGPLCVTPSQGQASVHGCAPQVGEQGGQEQGRSGLRLQQAAQGGCGAAAMLPSQKVCWIIPL